jgi:hypothetical protein
VKLHRCFAWNRNARPDEADGPLWFPRPLQGDGRHDNPDLYGCLYLAQSEVSAVVEQLARFRSQRLIDSMLWRRGLPLAMAEVELDDGARLVDLDDPTTLVKRGLRPSRIATRRRDLTQLQARDIYTDTKKTAGLSWWSSFEATWINVTLFDRGRSHLGLGTVRLLSTGDAAVIEAADLLGLRRV